jgi:S1-C subfamily serine protease
MNPLRLSVVLLLAHVPALAAEPFNPEGLADKLSKSTVTVRISNVAEAQPPAAATQPAAVDTIYLASGVSLGQGMIVTFSTAPMSARFRATLPDGQQAEAQLRVADDYSGLRLIEVANRALPALELASESPRVGAPVMSAAAMGLENPLVSLGIVSGVDHLPAGVDLPPLLVCDVRSTETSSGGPVMNRDGKLVGVVAATSNASPKAGWTYAVPVRHVARLVQAKAENQLVVLRRQRPIAGFTLGPGPKEGIVRVDRVEAGGPADLAKIKPGDVLLEADGRKIRSAYQAIDLILRKQPGDRVPLVVEQAGSARNLTMTLAGTPVVAHAFGTTDASLQVGPQVKVSMTGPNEVEVSRGGAGAGLAPAPRDDVSLLKAQLASFEQSVARLQEELRRRDQTQAETNKLIESMTEEIARLRKRLEK